MKLILRMNKNCFTYYIPQIFHHISLHQTVQYYYESILTDEVLHVGNETQLDIVH